MAVVVGDSKFDDPKTRATITAGIAPRKAPR